MQEVRVQSLLRELRSPSLHGAAKKMYLFEYTHVKTHDPGSSVAPAWENRVVSWAESQGQTSTHAPLKLLAYESYKDITC